MDGTPAPYIRIVPGGEALLYADFEDLACACVYGSDRIPKE